MFMMTPLDQSCVHQPRGGVRLAVHFIKEVGLAQPISSVMGRPQLQQLIVWRALQPRSQLIKVPGIGEPDDQLGRGAPQETI
jgi:hypothetical protein